MLSSIFIAICVILGCFFNLNDCTDSNGTTGLIKTTSIKDDTIFISTIDGTLHAINKLTGSIKWSLKGDDVIANPLDQRPHFLTDPRDGSLYVFHQKDGIKKFPYTIPELVSSSPSKSSDGYLYTGDKKDQWIAVDANTGHKLETLTSENFPSKITNSNENVLFFGRTEYKISMFDIATRKKKFSITYYDYSAYVSSNETFDEKNFQFFSTSSQSKDDNLSYPYYHFTSSSNGLLITIDKKSGDIIWQIRFDYPIVAIYQYYQDLLHKINFAIFSSETLNNLAYESWRYKDLFKEYGSSKEKMAKKMLTPTLYIGHFNNRFYALPAFVLSAQIGISDTKLIEDQSNPPKAVTPSSVSESIKPNEDNNTSVVEIGHHRLPEKYKPDYIKSDIGIVYTDKNDEVKFLFPHEKPTCPVNDKKSNNKKSESFIQSKYLWSIGAIIVTLLGKKLYDKVKKRSIQIVESFTESNSSSRKSTSKNTNDSNQNSMHASMSLPELQNGLIKIGKILYDPKQKLGHGCDGTFVYKGFFESRPVAVKRLLPECYTLADREVDLLRDADQHANVIRYFCTESDSQFRYIAIELCQITLQDYVNRFDEFNDKIKPLNVLEQATKGLAHLHALDIVHRDIKPHNVLLSYPNNKGEIIAMISDFGLCKRLDIGHTSYSKKSGATGTEGWIAPELLDEDLSIPKRITKAIDIFSLGCVYYYVLTNGSHPFGDSVIRRQMNIMENSYNLEKLVKIKCDSYMQKVLIEKMISSDPKKRPIANDILKNPVFWSKTKQLQFLQDISDRIEKLDAADVIIVSLERNSNATIKNNWKTHIGQELQDDLKKFRSYNGVLLRDLLRAIRNKKHHYRELTDVVKKSLGELPDGFIDYFTSRFPKLILHTYDAMVCCKDEPILDAYY